MDFGERYLLQKCEILGLILSTREKRKKENFDSQVLWIIIDHPLCKNKGIKFLGQLEVPLQQVEFSQYKYV